jgi:oxygen-independent coproporphyrinogen-3 oxidase
VEETRLSRAEEADEMLLMGLRLAEGLDLDRLERFCGGAPSTATVAELTQQGLIEAIPGTRRIRASGSGRFILNEIVLRLALSLPSISLPTASSSAAELYPAAE